MTMDDIPSVSEIERESFPTMWPQTAYKRELQQNAMAHYLVVADSGHEERAHPSAGSTSGTSSCGLLARLKRRFAPREEPGPEQPRPERLVGFIGLWFMLEECHIVTVAVRADERRRGIGELLVITAIELSLLREQEVVTLECRVSNTGAQALYEKYGFERVGVRKRYYTDNNEDALIMTTAPIRTPEYRAAFAALTARHRERWGAPSVAPLEA
jgi:ribosomal-protein-alanine N-acetyltransferase